MPSFHGTALELKLGMKRIITVGSLGLTWCLGCAGSVAPPISAAQARSFQATVEQCKRAGGDEPLSPAGEKLRAAEADFYYAEHLPRDPERAQRMAVAAQEEANAALALAQKNGGARFASGDSSVAP